MSNIAFIGAGNMNASIIKGLINSNTSSDNIMVSNPSPEKREALEQSFGIKQSSSNIEAANFASVIVLGVKPHFIADVCNELSSQCDLSGKLIISVAAGIPVAQMQKLLPEQQAIVRAMPNTPAQIGLGMTGIYANENTSATQKQLAETLLKSTGEAIWLGEEHQIDQITSLSGSGPAYFFLFMEAMEQHAKNYGFDTETSRKIVEQTALGAAAMVKQNQNTDIEVLRANVTSKGGTTQAALETLVAGGLPQLVSKACNAALHRAQELAQNNK